MELSKWFDMLMPEQREFFEQKRGASLDDALHNKMLEFEFTTEHGVWVYTNGMFYVVEDGNLDRETYIKDQEEHGVERVVFLDWYGDVLYETEAKQHEGVEIVGGPTWTLWVDEPTFQQVLREPGLDDMKYDAESTETMLCLSADSIIEDDTEIEGDFMKWVRSGLDYRPDVVEVRIGLS